MRSVVHSVEETTQHNNAQAVLRWDDLCLRSYGTVTERPYPYQPSMKTEISERPYESLLPTKMSDQ